MSDNPLSIFCQTLTAQKKHDYPHSTGPLKSPLLKENMLKTTCIVCKKSARSSSVYCSDACILAHAQDSLGTQTIPTKSGAEGNQKPKSDVRVSISSESPKYPPLNLRKPRSSQICKYVAKSNNCVIVLAVKDCYYL